MFKKPFLVRSFGQVFHLATQLTSGIQLDLEFHALLMLLPICDPPCQPYGNNFFLKNCSVVEPEPPFLAEVGAGAVKKGVAQGPALTYST